jgi:hypothetical protein
MLVSKVVLDEAIVYLRVMADYPKSWLILLNPSLDVGISCLKEIVFCWALVLC